MNDQDLICICMSVTRGEIREAVRAGHISLDALKTTLLCCTGCGTCESRVRQVMEATLKEVAGATEPSEAKSKTG